MIQAVLCDFDGVVLPAGAIEAAAFEKVAARKDALAALGIESLS
ncbi:MAG TPA: hypothetical protein VE220_07380 [Gaiellaceae bacterium]|nr:hypothetical protein [Gaiellaceae bacterium]